MSWCCEVSGTNEHIQGSGCCGSSCAGGNIGCLASEPRIQSCLCQANVGCLDRADCGGFRPRGTAATGACPGPCQCAEEEAWNRNIPPKPNCEWFSNFMELRRQWSDHSRLQNCKCCNCRPYRKAAPCKPCLPPTTASSYSGNSISSSRDCQDCSKQRLSGGGSAARSSNILSSPPPECPPQNYNSQNTKNTQNKYFESRPSSRSCPEPSPQVRQPSSSCKPCSPSPRPILKKRSCCQCIPGFCMCQPMPRSCNCPPPVHVDARADRECSCECPSSPECACPPSERRFPRSRIKCPNAKMCCPLPRLPPGPKCLCSECQPCLPAPCDPCTSRKCKTIPPKTNPCKADSSCPTPSPCRPKSPTRSEPSRSEAHRSLPPCASCRKISASYHDNFFEESPPSQVPGLNRSRSSNFRPGQSPDARDGDEDGVVETERPHQCNCGPKGMCCDKDFTDDVGLEKVDMKKNRIKFGKLNMKSLLNPKLGLANSRIARSKLGNRINFNLRAINSFLQNSVCSSSLAKSSPSAVGLRSPTCSEPEKMKGYVMQKAKVGPTSSVMLGNDSCTTAATPVKSMPKIRLYDRLQTQTKRLNPFLKLESISS